MALFLLLKTCSCPFVRYFRTLFWDDITIICWWKLSKQTSYWSKTGFFFSVKIHNKFSFQKIVIRVSYFQMCLKIQRVSKGTTNQNMKCLKKHVLLCLVKPAIISCTEDIYEQADNGNLFHFHIIDSFFLQLSR